MTSESPSVAATSYTCAGCQVRFAGTDAQREHYRSEWHRYNIRRRASDLPPVTEDVFMQRLSAVKGAPVAAPVETFECKPCRKTFSSANAHANHVASRKHRDAEQSYVPVDQSAAPSKAHTAQREQKKSVRAILEGLTEDASEDAVAAAFDAHLTVTRRLRPTECMFCSYEDADQVSCVEHMRAVHGLFVPDADYVSDMPGLLAYLADKLAVAHLCLACPPGRAPFASLAAVRQHMQDVGHAKIRFDSAGAEELEDFYDYVLSDDGDSAYDDDGEWVSGDEDLDDDTTLYVSPDESCMILPSGKRVASRAHAERLRRAAKHTEALSEETQEDGCSLVRRNADGQTVVPRLGDTRLALSAATPAEIRRYFADQRVGHAHTAELDLSQGVRNNGMQHHFRLQLRQ